MSQGIHPPGLRKNWLARISPSTTAVLVIDMVNDFIDSAAPMQAAGGQLIIPKILSLLGAARERQVPVIFVVERHRPGNRDYGIELEIEPEHGVEGTFGSEVVRELTPQSEDLVVIKRRYDAFFSTELDLVLRSNGIENIILTGTATELCVASTAYHAKSLDYRVFFAEDCLAGSSVEKHEAFLLCAVPWIGQRITAADAISSLSCDGGGPAA